ncbi:NUDIX hydrolase [Macrococcoides goetzii]|nr:NUDIX hydrolase [Macrococcus goetzii]TDM42725.1 NUDIX hydrolase [Macrococcus goetzii]
MNWKKRRIIDKTDYRVFQVITTEFSYQTQSAEFYQIEAPQWVNIIAEHKDCIIMIRQFRIGIQDYTLELPGGIVDRDELPLIAGQRELSEETGYLGEAQVIGVMHPNPALFTNQLTTILVTDSKQSGTISREIFEDIAIDLVPIKDLKTKIAHGEITNALTLASLMQYFSL